MHQRCLSLALENKVIYNLGALQGIVQTTAHRQQLTKRMEPLAEENVKLKEAMKLMDKNIQRAQCERDLAESNARDLKYQKGALSKQLKTIFEQLERTSEQLRNTSEQLRSTSEKLKSISD